MVLLTSLACLLLLLWLVWRWKVTSHFQNLGIPGPPPNLCFGNIIELYRKGPLKCHEEWIKKYGRVLGYYYGMKKVLLVSDPHLLKNIFIKDFVKFIDREPVSPLFVYDPHYKYGQSVLNLPGKAWKDVRSVLTPTFTAAKMKQMSSSMNSSIDEMLGITDEAVGRDFDIRDLFGRLTLDVITRTAFGIKTDVFTNPTSKIVRSCRAFFENSYFSFFVFVGLSFPSLKNVCLWLEKLSINIRNMGLIPHTILFGGLESVIRSRRENPQAKSADLLQLMIDASASIEKDVDVSRLEAGNDDLDNKVGETGGKGTKRMTDAEIVSSAFVVLLAGYETTSTTLSFTTFLLAKHRSIQLKVYEEIQQLVESGQKLDYLTVNKLPYLDQVLCESLRLYPPVSLFCNRYAAEDVQYGELKIPKGTLIQAPVYTLHHDPEFWSEPEVFDPERFCNKPNMDGIQHLPFGVGPRNCLGMRFAQLEAKLALAHLVHRYHIVLGSRNKENVEIKMNIRFIAPRNGVYVKLERRQNEN